MSSIAEDFVDHLATQVPSLTKGTNLFAGPIRLASEHVPVNCVFVYVSDGFQPRPYMGCNKQFRRPFVEIRVRYDRNAYQTGNELATEIYDAMDLSEFSLSDASSTGVWCKPMRSAPTYISTTKDEFHHWSFDFEVGYEKDL